MLTRRALVNALVREVRRLRIERDTWQRAADDPDLNYRITRVADKLDAAQAKAGRTIVAEGGGL